MRTKAVCERRAFTLVELAIVLVIIGLIVGGVLAGQSLIRSAEIRKIVTEEREFAAAILTFRGKYNGWPGDITTASNYFSGVTNGDGNGFVGMSGPGIYGGAETNVTFGGSAYENWGIWQQLALAGFIKGQYSGQPGPLNGWHVVAGTNAPKSRVSDAAWCWGDPRYGWRGNRDWSNSLTFAQVPDPNADWTCSTAVLSAEEAMVLDQKIDDGMPITGDVAGGDLPACTSAWTDITMTNATYLTNSTGKVCLLVFKMVK